MTKLFNTPDTIVAQARSVQRIGDKSQISNKPAKTQSELLALAQACKAIAVKRNNYWYAETLTGKVLKSAAERIVITNFIRVWNQT
jgi:hypothetical protein